MTTDESDWGHPHLYHVGDISCRAGALKLTRTASRRRPVSEAYDPPNAAICWIYVRLRPLQGDLMSNTKLRVALRVRYCGSNCFGTFAKPSYGYAQRMRLLVRASVKPTSAWLNRRVAPDPGAVSTAACIQSRNHDNPKYPFSCKFESFGSFESKKSQNFHKIAPHGSLG